MDVVLSAYATVLAQSEWQSGCDLPSALARWGIVEAAPLLVGMWETTPYAYGRRALLPALARLSPDTAAALAGDALWDCEESVVQAAIAITPPSPRHLERLTELTLDSSEDPVLREAAAARIRREHRPR
jgi:hypothetical protein